MEVRTVQETNSGFKTKAMRDKENELKAQKHPKTCIRIRFPDKYIMQVMFFSQEKGNLYI